ncbi:uncharacterized protein LOC119406321 [Rhipicephalus sanguineus]|uniref:uncharacterized protein LOC119406321 n=1 Tax=Rhipicephalus sanguineus TaxID=34632 RepID=UPI001893FE12|nr:uncharacterized protein LOC119406321 [Rhipicephalus sanguineus]
MDKLKAKRTSRRSLNSRIINEASALLRNDSATHEQLDSIYERLKTNNDELNKINNELESVITDEDFQSEYETILEYEDNATRILAELISRRNRISSTPAEEGSGSGPATNVIATPSERTGAKLPKLTIAPFSGDVCKWTEFWEQFLQIVHNNVTLTTTEKFHYLRQFLKGDAASAVAGLPTTEACYKDAVDLLQKRFGDKTRQEQEYFARLRQLTPVRAYGDTRSLRQLYDHVIVNIRGLESLGVQRSSFSSMLCDVILRALPRDVVVLYHRTCAAQAENDAADNAGLDGLLKLLSVELESLEKSDYKDSSGRDSGAQHVATQPARSRPWKQPTSSVLHTKSTRDYQHYNEMCAFCSSKQHSTEACPTDMSLTQKKQVLSSDKRCFRCTTKGDRARYCKRRISCSKCKGRHASSMCDPDRIPQDSHQAARNDGASATVCSSLGRRRRISDGYNACVFLQTFRAWAVSDHNCRYVRGVFDGGSQRTFVTEELSRHLGLKCLGYINMALNTFASASNQAAENRRIVELRLRSQFSDMEFSLSAIEIPHICQDIGETRMEVSFVASFKKLGRDVADELAHASVITQSGISVLIGSDQMWRVLTGEVLRCEDNDSLIAMNSKLGWTFQGRTTFLTSQCATTRMMVCALKTQVVESDEFLRTFWELEHLGISDSVERPSEVSKVMQHFESTITYCDGRYEVALPWKEGYELSDNKQVAVTRLHKLLTRLAKQKGLLQTYDDTIREYVRAGHAEIVDDVPPEPDKLYYMPHKEVIREQALTTKVRVVFDASSHDKGCKSLNECLEKGDNLYQDLGKILLRFRTHPIAVIADIEKAFLQISIRKEDRDAFRFLWFAEGDLMGSQLQEWRMTRVPFGATCSPFLLTATILHHVRRTQAVKEKTSTRLAESFYVDDLVTGADTEDEAEEFCRAAQQIMKASGMVLRKWTTNSPNLMVALE